MAKYLDPQFQINKEDNEMLQIAKLSQIVLTYVTTLIITLGSMGIAVVKYDRNIDEKPLVQFYTTQTLSNVENVSGAGDCFASGFIHGILTKLSEETCVNMGFDCAKASLLCKTTVPKLFF